MDHCFFFLSLKTNTVSPRYVPQFKQTMWGNLGSLHFGHLLKLSLRKASCDLRHPRRVRVNFFFGSAMSLLYYKVNES